MILPYENMELGWFEDTTNFLLTRVPSINKVKNKEMSIEIVKISKKVVGIYGTC